MSACSLCDQNPIGYFNSLCFRHPAAENKASLHPLYTRRIANISRRNSNQENDHVVREAASVGGANLDVSATEKGVIFHCETR